MFSLLSECVSGHKMLCIKEAVLVAQSNLDVTLLCYFCYCGIMNSFQNPICKDFGALALLKRMKSAHILGMQHGAYMLFSPD